MRDPAPPSPPPEPSSYETQVITRAQLQMAQSLTQWIEIYGEELQTITENKRKNLLMKPDEVELCSICLCEFEEGDTIVKMSRCADHYFHNE